jgi:hypothetical protein
MNFGHATLPSSGAVTRLVPALATASSHEESDRAGGDWYSCNSFQQTE